MKLGNSEVCQTGFDDATGTLTLDFVDADNIEAGVAYIVKWEDGEDIVDPAFRGVTICNVDPASRRTVSEDEKVSFIGTYSPMLLTANSYTNLYLGSDNQLHCPTTADFYLNAFRAAVFVDIDGETVPSGIVVNFGDDATGIDVVQGSSLNGQSDDAWYRLDGRKFYGKPTLRGVYINDGKSVMIK